MSKWEKKIHASLVSSIGVENVKILVSNIRYLLAKLRIMNLRSWFERNYSKAIIPMLSIIYQLLSDKFYDFVGVIFKITMFIDNYDEANELLRQIRTDCESGRSDISDDDIHIEDPAYKLVPRRRQNNPGSDLEGSLLDRRLAYVFLFIL